MLRQYPHLYKESDISMRMFKYVYILTTNRCFSSNFPGVCQMVPFADFLNHENVDTNFDCVDKDGKSIGVDRNVEPNEKREDNSNMTDEEKKKDRQEKRDFISSMKTDLLDLEMRLRKKMEEEGHTVETEEAKNGREVSLKLMQATSKQLE